MNRLKRSLYGIKLWLLRFLFGDFTAWIITTVQTTLHYRFSAMYFAGHVNSTSGSVHNFRLNIHRLEKGLTNPNPKKSFADAYILETVELFESDRNNHQFDENTRLWGEAVLDRFFRTSEHTGNVAEAYARYQQLSVSPQKPDWMPYPLSDRPALSVSYDDLHKLARRRRSVRQFLDTPVEPELIEKAMGIAALSPSACNRQGFKFLFFNEKKIVENIVAIHGERSFTVPNIVVIIGCYRAYVNVGEINTPVIDSSLAAMSFLFALETLSLSSVCLNWSSDLKREKGIRQLIELEPDEFVVMLVGIGYPSPDAKIACSAKKSLPELLSIVDLPTSAVQNLQNTSFGLTHEK